MDMLAEDGFPIEDGVAVLAINEAIQDASVIPIEMFIVEQWNEEFLQEIQKKIDDAVTNRYRLDERGLIVRVSPVDLSIQIAGQSSLPGGLHKDLCHPAGTRMFAPLRRHFYWPSMALDCCSTVHSCTECSRERIRLRKHKSFLKTFPATAPLEFVATDVLGPLQKKKETSTHW